MADRSNQPASVVRRVAAVILDGIFVVLPGGLVWLALPGHQHFEVTTTSLLYATVAALYEIVLTASFGQTAGKRVVGIAVVNDAGDNPSVGAAAVRYVVKSLQPLSQAARWFGTHTRAASAVITVAWDVVLVVSIASDRGGQGLHDRVARTWVVNVTRRAPLAARLSGRRTHTGTMTASEPPTQNADVAPNIEVITYERSAFGRYRKRRVPRRR